MLDPDIRHALIGRLRRRHPDPAESRIWPEMSVALGASRVDVGLVNGHLTGYEIKSGSDNLNRLPGQVLNYGRCLDRASIVTTESRADSIGDHVPDWWGILIATPGTLGVKLTERRPQRANPDVDPFHVAQLMWRDEAWHELERRGLHHGLRRATRWELWDRLAELPLRELRSCVRSRLKARPAF